MNIIFQRNLPTTFRKVLPIILMWQGIQGIFGTVEKLMLLVGKNPYDVDFYTALRYD